jgi:tricarboxylate carrier
MSDDVPPFSLTKPRYDQSTWAGRSKHFYAVTSPKTLLLSTADIDAAKALLEKYKDGDRSASDAALWEARGTIEASLHPDTGEPIPKIFRFAMFGPANLFIVPSMLLPSTIASFGRTILAHWNNQSYNAAVNYANRNASSEAPMSTLAAAYTGAVGVSVSIALGASAIVKRVTNPGLATLVRATLPYSACAGAGCLNLMLMRQSELTDGVEVIDHEGTNHGRSLVAGQQGITKCCIARMLWNAPPMIIPPLIMAKLGGLSAFKSSPRLTLVAEVGIIGACIMAAVPPALGAFPQTDSIAASGLEPQFQGKKDSKGQPINTFFFNKGL